MNVTITKPCDVRLDGTVKALAAWTKLNLPDDKALKLIDAGYAESVNITEEARAMAADFGLRDPGADCWNWIKQHLPDVWEKHLLSMRTSDLDTARSTFDLMLSAWEGRHDHQQPDLLAA